MYTGLFYFSLANFKQFFSLIYKVYGRILWQTDFTSTFNGHIESIRYLSSKPVMSPCRIQTKDAPRNYRFDVDNTTGQSLRTGIQTGAETNKFAFTRGSEHTSIFTVVDAVNADYTFFFCHFAFRILSSQSYCFFLNMQYFCDNIFQSHVLLLLDSPNWKIIHPRLFPQQKPQVFTCGFVAERQGFEPWVPARVQRFSRPPRSTTPAPFHWSNSAFTLCDCKFTTKFRSRKIFPQKFCCLWRISMLLKVSHSPAAEVDGRYPRLGVGVGDVS